MPPIDWALALLEGASVKPEDNLHHEDPDQQERYRILFAEYMALIGLRGTHAIVRTYTAWRWYRSPHYTCCVTGSNVVAKPDDWVWVEVAAESPQAAVEHARKAAPYWPESRVRVYPEGSGNQLAQLLFDTAT